MTTCTSRPTPSTVLSAIGGHVGVGPNFGALGGTSPLKDVIGALLTYGLLTAVLMLIVCSAAWALASQSGSWHTAQKAKLGIFVALGGATLTGGALVWANWLLDLGAHL